MFEVDHPATQAWKRKRLAQVGIAVPSSMTFAPVDFERETFDDGLRHAGFIESAPTFFSWLGVTMYLENDVVLGTLRAIRGDELSERRRVRLRRAARDAGLRRPPRAGRGEPAREEGGRALPRILRARGAIATMRGMGYAHIEDLGSAEIDARYFAGRTRQAARRADRSDG